MPIPTAREYAVWPKDRTITVSDGTPIAYTVVGDGPKTPILFVNGWTCSDAYWVAIGPAMIEDTPSIRASYETKWDGSRFTDSNPRCCRRSTGIGEMSGGGRESNGLNAAQNCDPG